MPYAPKWEQQEREREIYKVSDWLKEILMGAKQATGSTPEVMFSWNATTEIFMNNNAKECHQSTSQVLSSSLLTLGFIVFYASRIT
jgi:hypothetical protein